MWSAYLQLKENTVGIFFITGRMTHSYIMVVALPLLPWCGPCQSSRAKILITLMSDRPTH